VNDEVLDNPRPAISKVVANVVIAVVASFRIGDVPWTTPIAVKFAVLRDRKGNSAIANRVAFASSALMNGTNTVTLSQVEYKYCTDCAIIRVASGASNKTVIFSEGESPTDKVGNPRPVAFITNCVDDICWFATSMTGCAASKVPTSADDEMLDVCSTITI